MIKNMKSQRGSVEVIVALVAIVVLAGAAYLVYNRQSSGTSNATDSFLPHSSTPLKVTTTASEKSDADAVEADSEMNAAADENLNDIDISGSDLQ